MKKLFAMIMVLCLLCGAVALASGIPETPNQESVVVFENLRREDFTVTIPANIQLTAVGEGLDALVEGTLNIEVNARAVNIPGSWVEVNLKGTENATGDWAFNLANGDDLVLYMLFNSDGDDVHIDDTVLRWDFKGAGGIESEALEVRAGALDAFWVAGTYTDTLTFEIRSEMP